MKLQLQMLVFIQPQEHQKVGAMILGEEAWGAVGIPVHTRDVQEG